MNSRRNGFKPLRAAEGPGSYSARDKLIGAALRVGVKAPTVILRELGSRGLQAAIDDRSNHTADHSLS